MDDSPFLEEEDLHAPGSVSMERFIGIYERTVS